MIANFSKFSLFALGMFFPALGVLIAQPQGAALLTPGSIKIEKIDLPSEAKKGSPTIRELGEDWYMLEVKFDTEATLTEELTVKFYTDMVDTLKEGANNVVILTAETTYINIPKGKGHVAAVYLHPSSVLRYGGKSGAEGIKKANVHVDLMEGGRMVDGLDMKKDDPNWFTQYAPVTGVLMTLKESPFWPAEAQKFNQIKSTTR
jgi:hypothetical protein